MPTPLLSNFTPSLMSPETLEQIFVQREDIAQDLVDRIILSATTPAKHHSLLIGSRGMGKTHLVSLVYYRLDRDQELKDKLIVAWLREEEWGVDSWLDLVVRIFRALGEATVDTKGLLVQLQQISIADAETLATQLLTELIGQKTLLLIIENLDELFAGLGEKGQQKFRAFLQEQQCCTILATTPALFAGVQNPSEPFFGFFNPIIPLSPLNWEEATVMLQKIAELDGQADLANFLRTPAGKARVRAVHHLAGGNPRVYTLFAQFITRESLDELVQAFMKMLDDLTPYYQSRMKELSNQQRKIIEFLVDRREAVMVKEIATQCFIEQRVVSGQLLQLRNKGYVVARTDSQNKRDSLYELTEVLMRLCMEVKKYRGQSVGLFVDFLRIWYRPSERPEQLEKLRENDGLIAEKHLELALASDIDPVFLIVSQEFQNSLAQKNKDLAVQILEELQAIGGISKEKYQQINELVNAGNFDKVKEILEQNIDIDIDPNDVHQLWLEGLLLFCMGKWSEALVILDRVVTADLKRGAAALSLQGISLGNLGRYEEAITKYDLALQSKSDDYESCYNRGVLLSKLGKYKEAIESYSCVRKIKSDNYEFWCNLGISQHHTGMYKEAVDSYNSALRLKSYSPQALNNLGISLEKLGKYKEAIDCYGHILKSNPHDYKAWYNRGISLYHLGKYEKAIRSFDRALKLNLKYYKAWYNRGSSLRCLDKYEEAISSYDRAIQIKPEDHQASYNKGLTLFNWGKYVEAIDSYDRAISIKSDKYNYWYSKGFVLFLMGDYSKALETWQQTFNIIHKITDRPSDVAVLIQRFIEALIPKCTQPAAKNMLAGLVQTYIKTAVLTELGTALVHTLKQVIAPDISDYTAQQWLELWQELLGDRPEMQLPFRLMRTAILYKQHPERKERLWLGLASEERSILDEALE
jgi:tetratricopeptide (TPR) repeat protein